MDAIWSWWFITIHFTVNFFFLFKPSSTHTSIWKRFSRSLAEEGDSGAEPSWTPLRRALMQRFYLTYLLWPDFSETLLFHLDHLLAQWMFWQVSSLWCVWKGLTVSFYDFSMKTCPMILHLTWHNYALLVLSQHNFGMSTSLFGGCLCSSLEDLGRKGWDREEVCSFQVSVWTWCCFNLSAHQWAVWWHLQTPFTCIVLAFATSLIELNIKSSD